ncbi:U4/U6.U5 tri-snRNP-associated protein 3, partial [Dimargaris cristalligena]
LMAMMGFGSFGSTQGEHVLNNTAGGASVKKQRQYRQYMNRQGGFNRPLDS